MRRGKGSVAMTAEVLARLSTGLGATKSGGVASRTLLLLLLLLAFGLVLVVYQGEGEPQPALGQSAPDEMRWRAVRTSSST
jgi:hypothetical protein